jgi:hypothetical protein
VALALQLSEARQLTIAGDFMRKTVFAFALPLTLTMLLGASAFSSTASTIVNFAQVFKSGNYPGFLKNDPSSQHCSFHVLYKRAANNQVSMWAHIVTPTKIYKFSTTSGQGANGGGVGTGPGGFVVAEPMSYISVGPDGTESGESKIVVIDSAKNAMVLFSYKAGNDGYDSQNRKFHFYEVSIIQDGQKSSCLIPRY